MQFVGVTCDDAVIVHPLVGVCVGVADHTLHRLFQELGGDRLASMFLGESTTLSVLQLQEVTLSTNLSYRTAQNPATKWNATCEYKNHGPVFACQRKLEKLKATVPSLFVLKRIVTLSDPAPILTTSRRGGLAKLGVDWPAERMTENTWP
jgi:hypothetical protein